MFPDTASSRYIAVAAVISIALLLFALSIFSPSTACSPTASSSSHKHYEHPLALKIKSAIRAADDLRTLPLRDLKRSCFLGDQERLKMVLLKIYEGKHVKISALGGSVTQGQGLEDGGELGVSRYTERLQQFFHKAGLHNVNVTNGGFAACSSSYFSSCLNIHLPTDADLVIVELAINDLPSYRDDPAGKSAFEKLIRRILERDNKPAVILANAFQHEENHPDPNEKTSLYLHNAEAFFFDVSSYYGIQMASTKAATWRLSQQGVPGFWVNSTWFHETFDIKNQKRFDNPPNVKTLSKYLFFDPHHFTSINGHRTISELVIEILIHTSAQLLNQPEIDERVVSDPLPPPIFTNNYAPRSETCLIGSSLKVAALPDMTGFNWTNEQRDPKKAPKLGYTGFGGGSELRFNVSTNISLAQQPVSITLGYLTSYDPVMAELEVTCQSGCTCEGSVFNGLDSSRQVSQLTMKRFTVSQSEHCILSIKIIGAPASPDCKERCKVKIGALVVEEGVATEVADGGKFELISEVFADGILSSGYGTKIRPSI
jgi:hypothetical protein